MPILGPIAIEFQDDETADVTRSSMFTGTTRVRNLPISREEWEAYQQQGLLIQDALKRCNADQREFVLTGASEDEWDSMFKAQEGSGRS